MKPILFALCLLVLLSNTANANGLTKTLACDTCGYNEAVVIARQQHIPPNCVAAGLDEGNISLGETTFYCPATSAILIVANPVTRTSFKFKVRTEQPYSWGSAYDIIVENLALSSSEDKALHMFYDIDEDFRQTMALRASREFESGSFVMAGTQSNISSTSSVDDPDCSDHAANILSNGHAYRNSLEEEFTNRITSQMGLQSWKDFTSRTTVTGGGLNLGTSGAGISVTFENIQTKYYLAKYWPNGDKLIFEVQYRGERREIVNKGRARSITDRYLDLVFKFDSPASRIDGTSVNRLMKPNNDFSDISISVCLSKQLDELLEEVRVINGQLGAGSLIESLGLDATEGGSMIPRAGNWVNYSGCRLTEAKGEICHSDSGDCYEVKARYISCD